MSSIGWLFDRNGIIFTAIAGQCISSVYESPSLLECELDMLHFLDDPITVRLYFYDFYMTGTDS